MLGNPIDPEKYRALNPISLARKASDLKGLRIYFDAGTNDRYGFGPSNQQFDEILKELEIAHTFHLIEGGEHSWGGGTVQKALVDSLTFVQEGFKTRIALPPPSPAAPAPAAPAVPASPEKPKDGV